MENNELIKYEGGLIKRVGNAINVTNKLLATIEPQLIPYRKKDKWGFCTSDKKIVIDCVYDDAKPFGNGLAPVKLNRKWGYINSKGFLKIPFLYDSVNIFSNNLAGIKKTPKGKWAFIDTNGNIVIDFIFYGAERFKNGIAEVIIIDELLNLKYPLINTHGEILKVEGIEPNKELSVCKENGYYGFCDENKNIIIEAKYEYAAEFVEDLALVCNEYYSFYIDKKGSEYFEP